MTPPPSFYDLTLQFHADMDLIYTDIASFRSIYEGFRTVHGDDAVKEVAFYFGQLLADNDADLAAVWYGGNADTLFSTIELRRIFEDFGAWAASLQ